MVWSFIHTGIARRVIMAANSEEVDLMGLGKHCSYCRRLDLLPFTCTKCQQVFCKEHINEDTHRCPNQQQGNVILPTCPLCQAVIILKDGASMNDQVERHIMSGCVELVATSKPARGDSLFHRCTYRKCKQKEVVAIACDRCHHNFCIRHRHYQDHHCKAASTTRQPVTVH